MVNNKKLIKNDIDIDNNNIKVVKKPRKSKLISSSNESSDGSSLDKNKRNKKEHKCNICEKIFQGLNDLRKHLRIHSDERPYSCTQCDKKFRQAGCLKNHIASQHGSDDEFICNYCTKSFPIKERLRLHLRIHTGEKPYCCAICSKRFARGGQLTQHLSTHNGLKRHRCEHCPAAFSFAANLKLHLKAHMNERDYTCHICGKGFVRPDALKKHLECFHANIKSVRCEVCNKMFKGHLMQHMRTHKNVRPHGCSACGATFSQRSQLVVHQRVHSGERPYRCRVCWNAFAHSSVLKLHIRKHTGEKPFKCQICKESGTAFSQLPHLKKHMQAIHGSDKAYMCNGCCQFYKTKFEHSSHVTTCEKILELYENSNGDKNNTAGSGNENLNENDSLTPMAVTKMRILVAVLLRRISTNERLKLLGYEKRLIDNVLIDSLKLAKRNFCEDTKLHEAERLKINIKELLDWLVPTDYMQKFHDEQKSVEELLEQLTRTHEELSF